MQQASGADQPQTQQQQPAQVPMPSPPPQWVAAMPYPPVPMMFPHHMMAPVAPPYGQHYVPYYHARQFYPHPHPKQYHHMQQQQGQEQGQPCGGSSEDNKTVWVGDLQHWMDESYLHSCFHHTGEVLSIKVIRNKHNGQSEGYGFVEFSSHAAAGEVLQNLNGMPMPNADTPFRLNWASFSMGERRSDSGSDLSIFVGDLASDVTDALLQETFSSKYPSVKGAKVVIDVNTGRSKGYGFVRFGEEKEKARAMDEMNGVYCSTRPMRIGAATPRKSGGFASNGFIQADEGSTNTTVFVGGLDPDTKEEDLRQAFSQYGEISSVKIPAGKQCGFVQFIHRNNAEEALQKLNGTMICKQTIRLSWGRNPANKQMRAELGNQVNNQYHGGPAYDGYGYAMPHDPSMYMTGYGTYPMYGNQQRVSQISF